jgi:hypothetical protein
VRRSICITFQGDRRYRDGRNIGKALFQIVILRLALRHADPPSVVVDRNGDVVGVVEGFSGSIEGGVIKVPVRRRELPDELRKVVCVLAVPGKTIFCGEVILVPPGEFCLWRQRHPVGRGTSDQIATHGNNRLATLRPKNLAKATRAATSPSRVSMARTSPSLSRRHRWIVAVDVPFVQIRSLVEGSTGLNHHLRPLGDAHLQAASTLWCTRPRCATIDRRGGPISRDVPWQHEYF